MKVVSSQWKILGHDSLEAGGGWWMAIHTQKSLFTPAAIHLYSRNKEALPEETQKMLIAALTQCQDLNDLVENMFPVRQD